MQRARGLRFLHSGEFQRLRSAVLEAGGDPELAGRKDCALTSPRGPRGVEGRSGEQGVGRGEETKSRVSQFSRPRSPAASVVWGMGTGT